MADRYENIRRALAMLGPGNSMQEQIAALDDLDHACDPDIIRALLDERDALRRALEDIRSQSAIDLAMQPNLFALTARLGDIYQITDATLIAHT